MATIVVPPPVHPGEACAECDAPAIVKRLTWSAWYGFCFTHDPQGESDFNYCGDCGQSPCAN